MPAVSSADSPVVTARAVHYPVDARPLVEVEHTDAAWYPGYLHAWLRRRPRGWDAVVSYHVDAGLQFYVCVPAGRVRRRPASS